jgi:hypothetical protein
MSGEEPKKVDHDEVDDKLDSQSAFPTIISFIIALIR